MVFASLLNATAATSIVTPRRLPPAVGVDTAKYSFDLPSFCCTFDFLGCILTTTNLWLNFPLKPKMNPLAKMVSFDTGNATTKHGKIPGKRLSERSKRQSRMRFTLQQHVFLPGFTSGRVNALVHYIIRYGHGPTARKATPWLGH
jgi:hypothetical protein